MLVAAAGAAPSQPPPKRSAQAVLSRHTGEVLTAEFSPSGRSFATGSSDRTIAISSSADDTMAELMLLRGHKRAVRRVRWFPDNLHLASASSDGSVIVWDLAEERKAEVLKNRDRRQSVNDCYVLNEHAVIAGSDDSSVNYWDIRVKSRPVLTFKEAYPVMGVAGDCDGLRIASAGIESVIRVYDVRAAAVGPCTRVTDEAVYRTVDGSSLDEKSEDEEEKEEGKAESGGLPVQPAVLAPAPVLSPPGMLFALAGHRNNVTSIAFSPTGAELVSTSADNNVYLWDTRATASQNRLLSAGRGPTHNFELTLHRVRFSPDGLSIGVGSADRCGFILAADTLEPILKLGGHSGAVAEVAFHPSERVVVTASLDKTAILRRL